MDESKLNKELKKQVGENSTKYKLVALKDEFPEIAEEVIKPLLPFSIMYFSGIIDILKFDISMLLIIGYSLILYICYYISISILLIFISYIFKDRITTKF